MRSPAAFCWVVSVSGNKKLCFNGEFLTNPYKQDDVLLVPVDILHKLPVAESWEDIDLVVSQNNTLRAEMNAEVVFEWSKYTTIERKSYLKQKVFKDPDACKRVIEGYKLEELEAFNPHDNFDYFLTKLIQKIENLNINWKARQKATDSYTGAIDILEFFKHWVEYNKGWEVIQEANSRNREKILQRVIHLAGQSYINANNLDMSCEPDEGRGPVDFKISMGQDITIIEVKLTIECECGNIITMVPPSRKYLQLRDNLEIKGFRFENIKYDKNSKVKEFQLCCDKCKNYISLGVD